MHLFFLNSFFSSVLHPYNNVLGCHQQWCGAKHRECYQKSVTRRESENGAEIVRSVQKVDGRQT